MQLQIRMDSKQNIVLCMMYVCVCKSGAHFDILCYSRLQCGKMHSLSVFDLNSIKSSAIHHDFQ